MNRGILLFGIGALGLMVPLRAQGQDGPRPFKGAAFASTGGTASNKQQGNGTLLPAVRRIGIDAPRTNIDAFRQFSRSQFSTLQGMAAQPLSEDELSSRVSRALDEVVSATGRFWNLSVDSSFDLMAPRIDDAQRKMVRERLTRDYDLDAWLTSDVTFSPDHTAVRLSLVSTRSSKRAVVAREDVLVEPQATFDELVKGLGTAMARLARTLGHDGAVTLERSDVMVLDFGTERGLAPHAVVQAGLVVLTSYHPQTGEFFRSRAVPLYTLEVLEARQGSALARIVERNRTALQEAQAIYGTDLAGRGQLLAWRQDAHAHARADGSWTEPYSAPFPVVDGAEAGFSPPRKRKTNTSRRARADAPSAAQDGHGTPPGSELASPAQDGNRFAPTPTAPQAPADPNAAEGTDVPNAAGSGDRGKETPPPADEARAGDPGAYPVFDAVRVGMGTTFGTLETDRGDRYSDFPASVINTLRGEAEIHLDEALTARPAVELNFFNGGDVTGNQFEVFAPVSMPVWRGRGKREILHAGGGLLINSGTVKTIRVKKDLGHFDLFGYALFQNDVQSLGRIEASAHLGLLSLFDGSLGAGAEIAFKQSNFLPQELGLFIRIRKGPEDWSQIAVGGTWEFKQAPH